MSLLKRQGFYNSITLYFGTILGFFNLVILFQRALEIEEIGFFNLMTAIALLYVQFASLGFTNVIARYFPYFKTDDKKHGGFPVFTFVICISAFLILAGGFLLLKETIINLYSDDKGAPLLGKYYSYVILLAFCLLTFSLQDAFLRAIFKTIVPSFFREVLLKIFTTVGILLIIQGVLNYDQFISYYLFSNLILVILVACYSYRVKVYKFSGVSSEVRAASRQMVNYGMFSMLGGSSVVLVQNLDVIILGIITNEAAVGIYGTFFSIAVVISIPAKALSTTSYQIIAHAWKDEDLEKIGKIYYKTSVVQLLIGSLLLVGLIINWENLLYLLHKEEYALHFNVFIIIGLGFLADITGGLNGVIISFSKQYKMVMLGLIIAAALCAILNLMLIPFMGMTGAALSYLLTMFSLNFIYSFYIKLKWGLQPFGKAHVLVLVIAAVSLALGLLVPRLINYYFDVVVRSAIVTIVFTALAWGLKVSADINDVIDTAILKLRNRRTQ